MESDEQILAIMTEETDLLEKLKELDRREGDEEIVDDSFKGRLLHYWVKFKIKEALGHLSLLLFLGIYCGVGGIVSEFWIEWKSV